MADRQSTNLTIATPLRLEQRAVRRGITRPSTRVVRVGMGEARSRSAVISGKLGNTDSGPLAVMGLAGGLVSGMHAGDLVVASEIHDPEGTLVMRCPSAPIIAGDLRRAGHTVHIGPLVTSRSIVTDPEHLRRLAETGAIAVDMEDAWLAAGPGNRPLAVVRVISDSAEEPLFRLAALRRGSRALATLRAAVPAVERWASATGARDVLLASPRSFCAGVERAIDIVQRALDRYGAPVYVRRQIVHNAHVVADLERRGAIFVTELDEVPIGGRTILAAHGVSPAVRQQAADRNLALIDATCPLVAKVHQEVRRHAAADRTVILIGHADHEEVVGSAGEAPEHVRVVATEAEAATVEVDDPDRIAFAMQTTLAVDEADRIATVLRGRFPAMRAPRHDDICYATSNRQQALRGIAADCDLVLVVGSTNSSNSLRLVEVAERVGPQARLIDDAGDIDPSWLSGVRTVGVTAGASAPPALVDDVVAAIGGLGATTVTERRSTEEDLRFTLPKEVS